MPTGEAPAVLPTGPEPEDVDVKQFYVPPTLSTRATPQGRRQPHSPNALTQTAGHWLAQASLSCVVSPPIIPTISRRCWMWYFQRCGTT